MMWPNADVDGVHVERIGRSGVQLLKNVRSEIIWCYFSTNSWIDQSERIAWCYFSMNSRID